MMRRRAVPRGGLRRRLTIVFMLAVGVSAAALAAGSYFILRHNLLSDSVDAGARQARRNLVVAPAYLRRGGPEAVLNAERGGNFLTVGVDRGRPFSSSFSVGLRQVPAALRRLVRRGRLGYERETVAGTRYLVVGGPVGRQTELYFFFSEQSLRHELALLRNILLAGLGILVVGAGLVGALLARRTLRPVAQASAAAQSLAGGLLETRLPVTGRDEFGTWAEAFNEMAAALEAKISALNAAQARERRFTADVAHELRTPLTALVGEASLLAEHLERMPSESRRPAEHLPHLFDRFYKADPARSGRGTGLGLAIARENARLLGGEIEVWSELGAGSRFTLRLNASATVTEPLRTRDGRVAEREEDGARQTKGGPP